MIFSTFYFSGTGNTQWVAEEFNRIVISRGAQGKIYPITDPALRDIATLKDIIDESDHIGFANPIYGADIPPVMKSFIGRVKSCLSNIPMNRPIYILNTFGYVNAFGPIAAQKLFAGTGLQITVYINIRLCNNISTPRLKTKPITEATLAQRKQQAKSILEKAVLQILASRKWISGIGPYLIPGILIRRFSSQGIAQHYQALGVNMESCRQCMKCVNECPTQSIKYSPQSGFTFLPTCTACMRCYNFCPAYSILMDGSFADPQIYFRYRGPERNS
jgi:NAD-dependent dihydropyrimidine dehydrogenase PreA subunit